MSTSPRTVSVVSSHPLNAIPCVRASKHWLFAWNDEQENAADVAKYLFAHPLVKKVYYPGLTDGEDLAAKGLRGAGGVLSFEVVDGIDPVDVLDNLELPALRFHWAPSKAWRSFRAV